MAKGSDARPYRAAGDGADAPTSRPATLGRPPVWALSPSDFAFLWDECPRCFYTKVVLKKPRPRTPFPSVFGRIDRAMKDCYLGQRAEELVPGAPVGVIGGADRWVRSAPITVPGCSRPFVIRGRVDALVECDDGTTGVIDFKTAEPNAELLETYARQLHAYAFALEYPSVGTSAVVSALGLLSFSPERFEAEGRSGALRGGVTWTPVPHDPQAFVAFLGEVLTTLDQPQPPPPSTGCPWCYRLGDVEKVA